MNPPAPFYAWDEHLAVDLRGARAVFTTRRGGFSAKAPYASMNLGRLTDDDPDAVDRNRASLQDKLGVSLAHIRQVHGTAVRRLATEPPPVPPGRPVQLPEFDGQATALAGVAPMVLVADCLPIAVAGGGAVAMLHAGWRGLAGGIVAEGVKALSELGDGGPLQAAIGPGAGPCCYEVGEEVHEAFSEHAAQARHGRNLDLKAIARAKLRDAGVAVIHDVGLCTICSDRSLLFSHRRDAGVTGSQAGIAWLSR
jgi:YfiH family protein